MPTILSKNEEEKSDGGAAPPPPKYIAKAIHFVAAEGWSGKVVKFADKKYIKEIDKVANIMKGDPTLDVKIEAYIGYAYTLLDRLFGPPSSWAEIRRIRWLEK